MDKAVNVSYQNSKLNTKEQTEFHYLMGKILLELIIRYFYTVAIVIYESFDF